MSRRRIVAFLREQCIGIAMILVATPLASASLSWAAVSFDVSVGLPIGDDARLFLNITNEYYAPPPQVATVVVRRCPHPEDDYPVILFLARASGRSPGEILDLRLRGDSWSVVMHRLRVVPSVLFAGIDRDPGPPYGRAWGHYKNHRRRKFEIRDRDFVDLIKLQVASKYYRVSPSMVVAERRRGRTVEQFAADRHRSQEHARNEDRKDGADRGEAHGARKQDKGPKSQGEKPSKSHGKPHNH